MEKTPGRMMDDLITNVAGSAWFGPYGAECFRTGNDGVHRPRNLGIAWIVYGFVRAALPEVILEVGSGGSSIPILYGLRDNLGFPPFETGHLYTIDSFPWGDEIEEDGVKYRQPHLAFIKLLGNLNFNELCTFYHAKSQDVGQTWDKPIDMLVVDGDHTAKAAASDWQLFSKWLKPGGYAFFHDVVACHHDIGIMLEEACMEDSGFSFAMEPNSLGLSIIQKKFTLSPEGFSENVNRQRLEGFENDPKASLTDSRKTGLLGQWEGRYILTLEDWNKRFFGGGK